MTLSGILLLGGFAILTVLMVVRLLPTILALPIMAAWIAFIAGVPFVHWLNDILLGGALRLGLPIVMVIFGAMFAKVIQKTGISDEIIKTAAELAGDNPLAIAAVMTAATAFVFFGMTGLGAVIMIATIAVPIMTSAGIEPIDAVILILFGLTLGNTVNFAGLATGIGLFGSEAVMRYYVPGIFVATVMAIAYLAISIPRGKNSGGSILNLLAGIFRGLLSVPGSLIRAVAKIFSREPSGLIKKKKKLPAAALITPILPLIIIGAIRFTVGFGKAADGKIDPMAAAILGFFIASFYATFLIKPKQAVQLFAGAIVEGIQDVAGVIFLFMGIGMLVTASMHPAAVEILNPLITALLPSSIFGVLIAFAIFAPAALYRGPLNMFGMGSGIAAILMSVNFLPSSMLYGLFAAVTFMQAADPTNSQNTWLGGFAKVDTTAILKKMLPFVWGGCILMLIIVAVMQ